MPNTELEKLAMGFVATDRQLAVVTAAALRAFSAQRKATARVQRAVLFADALSRALESTRVNRA